MAGDDAVKRHLSTPNDKFRNSGIERETAERKGEATRHWQSWSVYCQLPNEQLGQEGKELVLVLNQVLLQDNHQFVGSFGETRGVVEVDV